jgi:hypothetical protein
MRQTKRGAAGVVLAGYPYDVRAEPDPRDADGTPAAVTYGADGIAFAARLTCDDAVTRAASLVGRVWRAHLGVPAGDWEAGAVRIGDRLWGVMTSPDPMPFHGRIDAGAGAVVIEDRGLLPTALTALRLVNVQWLNWQRERLKLLGPAMERDCGLSGGQP